MIRLLWRTDIHNRDSGPESRTDDWSDTVMGKIVQVGDIARKYACDAVIDGGDFFDDKTPIRTTHRLVSRTARVHKGYPCPVFANVGNHDVRLGQLCNLHENPIEVLFATGVFSRLYDEHECVIEKDGVKVRVVGIPYHGPRYDMDRFRSIERGDEDYLLCNAHVLASPQGGEMFKNEDIIRYSDLPSLNPAVDVWMFGHWHKNQGIQQIAEDKWVVNTGSLTRGALTEDNIQRKPGVVVMGFWPKDRGMPPTLEFVEIDVQDAKEVFDMEKRVREEARAMTVDAFVESVKEELQASSDKPIPEIVEGMDLPAQVKERCLEFIDKARR